MNSSTQMNQEALDTHPEKHTATGEVRLVFLIFYSVEGMIFSRMGSKRIQPLKGDIVVFFIVYKTFGFYE